jgi:hypothetical protein
MLLIGGEPSSFPAPRGAASLRFQEEPWGIRGTKSATRGENYGHPLLPYLLMRGYAPPDLIPSEKNLSDKLQGTCSWHYSLTDNNSWIDSTRKLSYYNCKLGKEGE